MENKKFENLAKDIYNWCMKNDLWGDICLYFNNRAWASWSTWHGVPGKKIGERLYEYEDKNPRDYFNGGDCEFACSFEGELNHILNAYVPGWVKLEEEFLNLFKKYGLFFEMYDSWNGNAYKI